MCYCFIISLYWLRLFLYCLLFSENQLFDICDAPRDMNISNFGMFYITSPNYPGSYGSTSCTKPVRIYGGSFVLTLHHAWLIRGSCSDFFLFTYNTQTTKCCGIMYDQSFTCNHIISVQLNEIWIEWGAVITGKTNYGFLMEVTGRT